MSAATGRRYIPCRERASHVGTGGLVRPAGPPRQVSYRSSFSGDTRTRLVYPQSTPCPVCNGSGFMVDPATADLPPMKRTVLRLPDMCFDPRPDRSKSGTQSMDCASCRYVVRWDELDGDPLHGAYVHTAEAWRAPYPSETPQEV